MLCSMADLFREEVPKSYKSAKCTSGHVIFGLYDILEHDTTDNDKSNAGRLDPEVFVNCVQDKEVR